MQLHVFCLKIIYACMIATLYEAIPQECPMKCRCVNTTVDCQNQLLTVLPANLPTNCTALIFSNNLLVELDATSFDQLRQNNLLLLDLSRNKINCIANGTFAKMTNLHTLILDGNEVGITRFTFVGMSNLRTILHREMKFGGRIPIFGNLTKLEAIDLSRCSIKGARLPKDYSELINLKTFILNGNKLKSITSHNLQHLNCENIVTFSCEFCDLVIIDTILLFRFRSLKVLHLAYNSFTITSLQSILTGLSLSFHLTLFDISAMKLDRNLPADFFRPLSNCTLQTLVLFNLFRTHSETDQDMPLTLKSGTFKSLKTLKNLDLSYSLITSVEDLAFEGLDSLQTLDMSNALIEPLTTMSISYPPTLKRLNLSGNGLFLDKISSFTRLNDLVELKLSGSSHFPFKSLSFSPNNSLSYLELTNSNLMDRADEQPFAMLTKLTTLDLTNSKIKLEHHLLYGLTNLRTLNLSSCNIYHLVVGLFRDQGNLRVLDFRKNFLTELHDEIYLPLSNLQLLLLIDNRIEIISESFFQMWSNLHIDLRSNRFNCSCDMLWFRRHMDTDTTDNKVILLNKYKYTCLAPMEYFAKFFINIQASDLERKCFKPTYAKFIYLFAVLNIGAIIFFVFTALIYRYRWYIKWTYYKRCTALLNNLNSGDIVLHKLNEYNVYFSYAEEDIDWVEEMLSKIEIYLNNGSAQAVEITTPISIFNSSNDNQNIACNDDQTGEENSERRHYRFYYDKRNTQPHLSMIGQMAEAIYNSQHAVVVLSLSYLNTAKNKFELDLIQTALMERYGQTAYEHMIFVTVSKTTRLAYLLPSYLRHHFDSSAVVWNSYDYVLQREFLVELKNRLK